MSLAFYVLHCMQMPQFHKIEGKCLQYFTGHTHRALNMAQEMACYVLSTRKHGGAKETPGLSFPGVFFILTEYTSSVDAEPLICE